MRGRHQLNIRRETVEMLDAVRESEPMAASYDQAIKVLYRRWMKSGGANGQ